MRLEVRDAQARDIPEIKRLTDEYISEDYYSLNTLEAMLHGDRNLFYVVTDADKGDAIISYFYAFLSGLDEALQILHVPEKPEALQNYPGDTPVAVYKASSTEKAYRKHGICSSFVRDQEPVVRARGAKLILATALHPVGRQVPMRHIFLDNGFTAIADIYRPWVSIRGHCPYCKQEYCTCDAVFYLKKLDETEDKEFNE
ncbi:MAG: hypothetical protein IKH57_16115 [Clostridia bacterium]|nr:hypothetical protein [Clostridia bacterium]